MSSRDDYGGQRANMEDDSMVGTLEHQARLIWPMESRHLRATLSAAPQRVLDLACGTGEILHRFRAEFEPRLAVGVDLFRGHLERAEPPVVLGDGRRLPFPDGAFDLVLVRHLLQAVPDPVGLLVEARRVGRRVHLLVEDYAALFFDLDDDAAEGHFTDVTPRFRPQGTDLFQGRRAYRHLREAGFHDITVAPLVIDTLNSDREAFAQVMHYWKLGYAETLAGLLGEAVPEIERRFDLMIAAIRDEGRYSAWLLFALSATSV
jgi:ubiquinone/menaquinone biosynthesis C-methylase UbiE